MNAPGALSAYFFSVFLLVLCKCLADLRLMRPHDPWQYIVAICATTFGITPFSIPKYGVALPPQPNFLYTPIFQARIHTYTAFSHARGSRNWPGKTCLRHSNFFSAVLSLLHKVLKLKGGVRNVSMQLFDWGRESSSEDTINSLVFPQSSPL